MISMPTRQHLDRLFPLRASRNKGKRLRASGHPRFTRTLPVEGSLDAKLIYDIVNCLFEAEEDNLITTHKNILRPPLQDSLLKLKAKFSREK